MSVNDASRILIGDFRVLLQIEASLTDYSRGVIVLIVVALTVVGLIFIVLIVTAPVMCRDDLSGGIKLVRGRRKYVA